MGEKIGEYLECGVPVVWLVDPQHEVVSVYRSLTDIRRLTVDDTISAEPVLPGFAVKVARFFK